MPKIATKVDRELLTKTIAEVENSTIPLNGLTELYERVSTVYNEASPIHITPSIVRSRIIEWKLPIKTVSPRRSNKVRTIRTTTPTDHFEFLEEDVPARWRGLVASIKKGSKVAGIKLHCIQCFGYEDGVVDMIRGCTGHKTCALWSLRPYK